MDIRPAVDQQILRGAAASLSWQYLDAAGEPADPGTVTVGVTRADGTVLVAAGTATAGTGANPRTAALTATQTAPLDVLAVTWTRSADATTYPTLAEVVGGYYFTVAQARASDPALADDAKYTPGDIQAARADIEAEFEDICHVAFVPRYRRRRLNGTGALWLMLPTPLPRRIIAVAELDSQGTASNWSAPDIAGIDLAQTGKLTSRRRAFPCGDNNLVVAWEHGHDRPPRDVLGAALLRLRHRAIRPHTAIPDRATSFQLEGGSVYRLDTARRDRTGIPDVDDTLARWSMEGL